MPTRCTATTAKGMPCKAWAVPGTDPPRCAAHGGKKGDAPKGSTNVPERGVYPSPPSAGRTARPSPPPPSPRPEGTGGADLDARIADLNRRIDRLGEYIDERINDGELELDGIVKLLALHGQLSSRLGRLMRDRQQIAGDQADELQRAINQALDMIAEEWRIEL